MATPKHTSVKCEHCHHWFVTIDEKRVKSQVCYICKPQKKSKIPGRVLKTCESEKCKMKDKPNVFSTHSTNRVMCHECKPKCREIHYFNQPPPVEEKSQSVFIKI
jgi:hypothetical protein